METIKRLEKMNGLLKAQAETVGRIRSALQAAGVVFIEDEKENNRDGDGPGVRLSGQQNQFVKEISKEISYGAALVVSELIRENPKVFERMADFCDVFSKRLKVIFLITLSTQYQLQLFLAGICPIRLKAALGRKSSRAAHAENPRGALCAAALEPSRGIRPLQGRP